MLEFFGLLLILSLSFRSGVLADLDWESGVTFLVHNAKPAACSHRGGASQLSSPVGTFCSPSSSPNIKPKTFLLLTLSLILPLPPRILAGAEYIAQST
jgi:hypothetical protein